MYSSLGVWHYKEKTWVLYVHGKEVFRTTDYTKVNLEFLSKEIFKTKKLTMSNVSPTVTIVIST